MNWDIVDSGMCHITMVHINMVVSWLFGFARGSISLVIFIPGGHPDDCRLWWMGSVDVVTTVLYF